MSDKSKFLLVDDDELNGNLFSKRLAKKGFICDFVKTAEECFKALEKEDYDVLLLDIMMPDMPGTEILSKVRETKNSFELPVMMVTSKDETQDIVESLKLGANDYLTKPVNMEIAIARLNTQLQIKNLNKESLKAKQTNTVNVMVTTLNHEINNPLAIAIGNLSIIKENPDTEKINKALKALDRITQLVKKIDKISTTEMEEVSYSETVNMYKID